MVKYHKFRCALIFVSLFFDILIHALFLAASVSLAAENEGPGVLSGPKVQEGNVIMKKKEKSLHLKSKLALSFSLLLSCIILVQSLISYSNLHTAYQTIENSTMQKLDTLIKTEVQSVIGVLTENENRHKAGEISEEAAMQNAEKIVRDTRYNNGSGYFWADMADGKCVVHMNSSYQGQMRLNNKDSKGNYYIRNLIAAGNKGGGFTDFWFTKPGKQGEFQKRGYTQEFKPYGWYISTGNYQEDMTPMIQAELDECGQKESTAMLVVVLSSIAVGVVGVLLILLIANSIVRPLKQVTERLRLLSLGDLHSPVTVIDSGDETGELSHTAKTTVEQLNGYISDITEHLSRMSEGDFSGGVTMQYVGDFAPIGTSIRQITESLSHVVSSIHNSASTFSKTSEQAASGSHKIAEGAAHQAASVEELSATIGEISSRITQNAQSAAQANEISQKTGKSLQAGNQKMQQMLASMNEISTASSKIQKVVKTISDIAFQTNILALNAAVEAAHAGEAGRGFAVVADEVRNLATKSAEAVKATTELIENTINAVGRGSEIAKDTAQTISAVIRDSAQSLQLIESIAGASEKQAEAVGQVTTGIEQISSVVQSNSSAAELSASVSERLSGEAKEMQRSLARFRLEA